MRSIHIKKIITGFVALILLFSMPVLSFADDGYQIGNFESETSGTQEEEQLIALSDGTSYSPDTGMFYHAVENSRFGTNIPDGTITTEAVSVVLDSALIGTLYRNGVEMVEADLSDISEPGKYVLAVSANDSMKTVRIKFTIASSPTGDIKEYQMPADFYVVSATLDGKKTNYSRSYVDMTDDGEYEIRYRSPKAKKDYCLTLTVDHTPPTATLSGIESGKANGPVTVSGIEEGTTLYLDRNGTEIPFDGVIDKTGSYVLTVQDKAGNETNYEFVVVTYANNGLKYLIIMGVALILALAGYYLFYRKYMRVN